MNEFAIHENIHYELDTLPFSCERHSGEHYLAMHRHEEYEILFVKRGVFSITVNDRTITLRRNQALLIDRYDTHGMTEHRSEPNAEYIRFNFSKSFLFPSAGSYISTKFYRESDPLHFTLTQTFNGEAKWHHSVIWHMQELESLITDPHENALSIQIHILAIFDRLQKESAFYPIPHDLPIRSEFVRTALIYMSENFMQKLTIAAIADSLHVSTNHFIKTFREDTGMTPKQYLIKERIKEAVSLMQNVADDEIAVSDIAFKVGIDDVNYFSRIFKKEIGMSPTRFIQEKR